MHFQAAFHHLLMQSKSWKQKREASSLHTSSQGAVEKQWHQEKQSQRPGQQKVPRRSSINNKNYTWLPSLETLMMSPAPFPPHSNQPTQNSCPASGCLLFWSLSTLCFHGKLYLFLTEDEFPSIFGSPLLSLSCCQGAAPDQRRALLPR